MRIKDKVRAKLPPVQPGVYMAVCVGVIDLGEQYSERFKSYRNEVQFVFELCGETITVDGEQKPRQLSRTFTFSASKKGNLRAFLSSWNATSYTDDAFCELDLYDQLGLGAQLNVLLNESGEYANIESIMPLPRGITPPAPAPGTELIRWDTAVWDDAAFDKLPDWVQDKLRKSTQYRELHAPTDVVGTTESAPTATPAAYNAPMAAPAAYNAPIAAPAAYNAPIAAPAAYNAPIAAPAAYNAPMAAPAAYNAPTSAERELPF